jgi:hypothetical protein
MLTLLRNEHSGAALTATNPMIASTSPRLDRVVKPLDRLSIDDT